MSKKKKILIILVIWICFIVTIFITKLDFTNYEVIRKKILNYKNKIKEPFTEEDINFIEKCLNQNKDSSLKIFIMKEVLIYDGNNTKKKYQINKILKKFILNSNIENKYKDIAIKRLIIERGDTETINFLKELVLSTSDIKMQISGGEVLYNLGEKKIGYKIYEKLVNKGVRVKHSPAPHGFDFSNDPEAKPMLFRIITYDNNPCSQGLALYYLASLGEYESLLEIYKKLKNRLESGDIKDEEKYAVSHNLKLTKEIWIKRGKKNK